MMISKKALPRRTVLRGLGTAMALPMLEAKFRRHLARRFPSKQQAAIVELCLDQAALEATPVNEFLDRFVI